MTTLHEAAQQALEALKKTEQAMESFRAALAQEQCELNEVLTERDDAEDYIDALLDEVLGPDRAEWSSAYGRAEALEEVRERIAQMLKPSIDKAWNRFEAALAQEQAEPDTCTWQQDGYVESSTYRTSCGHYFNLEDGTPADNKMAHCCYCGKKLVQELITENNDE